MIAEQAVVEETAETLFAAEKPAIARTYLTKYIHGKAAEALDLGAALLASIEARTRVLYGIREPETEESQRLAPAPYSWRAVRDTPADVTGHPTMARGEDDAPHRRRGIPRGLCSGGAGAKMAFEMPILRLAQGAQATPHPERYSESAG